jgi:hypothetical protein
VSGGLFFAGLEQNGKVYIFNLNSDLTSNLINSFASGETKITDLEFDPKTGYLWTECDSGCAGRHHVFTITSGSFTEKANVNPPAGPTALAGLNIEGFTIEPESRCNTVTNLKYAYWANDDNGALMRGQMHCGTAGSFLSPGVPVESQAPTAVPTGPTPVPTVMLTSIPTRAPSYNPTAVPVVCGGPMATCSIGSDCCGSSNCKRSRCR